MNKNWYDDDDGWSPQTLDEECLECGARDYRSSNVPGVCNACLNGEHDDTELSFGVLYDSDLDEDFILLV